MPSTSSSTSTSMPSSSMPSSSSSSSASSSSSSSMPSSSATSMPSSSASSTPQSSSLSSSILSLVPAIPSSSPKKKRSEMQQFASRTLDLDIVLDKEDDIEKCLKTDLKAKKQLDQMPQWSNRIKEGVMVHTIEPNTVEVMNPEDVGHIEVSEKMSYGRDLEGNMKEEEDEEDYDEKEEEGQCRVCHLVFDVELGTAETIDIGCHCKHDLGIAHRNCAEAWFKIKGNRICEICGATAQNIVGNEDSNFMEQWNDVDADAENRAESHARCWQSLSLCNFFLACMVVTFILLWLFRVTIS